MTLIELIDTHAVKDGKHKAVVFENHSLTYSGLKDQSERIAAGLRKIHGIEKGDRVCLFMTNSLDFVPCFFGVLKAGASVIPVNTFLAAEEVGFILNDSRAKVVIASEDLLNTALAAIQKTGRNIPVIQTGAQTVENTATLRSLAGIERFCAPGISPDDTAALIYTSGTTGIPKAAVLSHGNLTANTSDCVRALRVTGRDRFIVFLPLFHSFTITVCMLTPLTGGGSLYILKSVKPFDKVMKTILLKRITGFVGIPQIYHLLGEKKLPWWIRKLIKIRFCISGSAPLSEEVLKNFEKNTGLVLMEGYGLSEASPVVSVNPLYGKRKVGSVGPPLSSVRISIRDEAGNELPCGQSGEICVKGPSIMKGYFEKPEETANVLKDGWLSTGDIGRADEDGYLYILDRKKDLIKCHGMNVYPREVEQVLYKHPAVKEAAVIGIKDDHRGEIPIAYITLKEGNEIPSGRLVKFCKDKLAPYKIPHRINIVRDLPRNSTGKILKKQLKEAAKQL